MAVTAFSPTIFSKEAILKRRQNNVFMNYVNSEFTGELKSHGNTVTVLNIPTITFTVNTIAGAGAGAVGTGPGGVIAQTAFAITPENLLIDKYSNINISIRDIDSTQSDINLEAAVAKEYAEGEALMMDTFVRDLVLVTHVAALPAANKINSGAPVALTKANIIEELEKMIVVLDDENVTEGRVLFVSPAAASLYRQANIFDATDSGLALRQKGYLGSYGGVEFVKTKALSASKEMIMMAKNAINVVVQLNKVDTRQGTDGFYENLITEVIFGGQIFAENKKAIVINYVA